MCEPCQCVCVLLLCVYLLYSHALKMIIYGHVILFLIFIRLTETDLLGNFCNLAPSS